MALSRPATAGAGPGGSGILDSGERRRSGPCREPIRIRIRNGTFVIVSCHQSRQAAKCTLATIGPRN
jgi:hypothetical protein